MRILTALAAATALTACGGNGSNTTTVDNVTAAAPVAAKAAPAGTNWVETVTRTPEGGWLMGNPDAPIKLVEFGSRTCHVCREFDEVGYTPLTTKYVATGKVSYEFRDFLRNGADVAAALVGGCGGTGPFFPILNQMYADQPRVLDVLQKLPQSYYDELGKLNQGQQATKFAEGAGYIDFAKQRGIPEAQARTCLADAKAAEQLIKMNEKANADYPIPGTPTFLLNGKMLENTVSWPQVETALKSAGA
ncbi:DsbA family protein [Sphingomonas donggukensis]|uniref:DsbA family protein n=1 Tax=Sphingomonas donggukensis TaxID=2949093 RepID=A0ABY4TRJ9_9SPHN|nr:thioredoxin domain-containing protein [Sphingomonas donggukensis]URW75005.1 DsbA family protein [Sphingomonas donggukensis]